MWDRQFLTQSGWKAILNVCQVAPPGVTGVGSLYLQWTLSVLTIKFDKQKHPQWSIKSPKTNRKLSEINKKESK